MNFREILEQHGYKVLDRGSEYRTTAHYRNGTNPMSVAIRKDSGFFHDFGSGQRGTFQDFLRLIGAKGVEVDSTSFTPHRQTLNFIPPMHEWEEFTLVKTFDFFLKRGISAKTIEEFEGRLCLSGKFNRRFVFPIRENGKVVGITGRVVTKSDEEACEKNGKPKWKKSGKSKEWVFPLAALPYIKEKREVILVESVGDMLALWEAGIKNVLVLFGTEIHSKVICEIIKWNCKVYIATNNEPDNNFIGLNAAQKAEEKLLKFLPKSRIKIYLPTRKDFGKMGEINKQEILDWYARRED